MVFIALYAALGLLFMGVSRPLIRRRVGPNYFYGFRTPKTLSNPDIWYPANEFCGRRMFAAGVLILVCALLLSPLNLWGEKGFGLYTLAMVGIMMVSIFGAVIASFRFLNRL